MNPFSCPPGGPVVEYTDRGEKITSNCLTCSGCGECARGYVPMFFTREVS